MPTAPPVDTDTDDCDRCGSSFLTELVVVDRPPAGAPIDRDRIEATLCYNCRQSQPHEPLGELRRGGAERERNEVEL